MKIQNNTKTTYTHGDLKLLPNGAITEVEDKKLIDMWLKIDGVIEYITPEDVETQLKDLKEENKKLKAEIAALKEKKEEKDEVKKEVKKTAKKGK